MSSSSRLKRANLYFKYINQIYFTYNKQQFHTNHCRYIYIYKGQVYIGTYIQMSPTRIWIRSKINIEYSDYLGIGLECSTIIG
jgi:hypothetical protein